MNSYKLTHALLAILASAALATAAEEAATPPAAKRPAATLKVGDPAPRLQTGKWIQGEPVQEFSSNSVYLVEFWATWCGPCKAAIPHINEVCLKFKDRGFVVIGQNVWETTESAVAPFVKKMGEQMTYRVVLDDKSDSGKGRMAATWLAAAGQAGIPASFLVDKHGRLAWIGHPMELQESYLEQVLADKHDTKPVAAVAEQAAARRDAVSAKAQEINPYLRRFSSQLNAGQWAEAEQSVKKIAELAADLPAGEKARLSFQRYRLLVAKGDFDAAAEYAETKMKVLSADTTMQANVARLMAEASGVKGAGLALAAKLAEAGYAKGGQNAQWFDTTLARIKFIQGDQEKAVQLQTEALKNAGNAKQILKDRLQADLDSYKAGKLPTKH